jgi:hypothetical protein
MITADGQWSGSMKDRLEMFFGPAKDEKREEAKKKA